MEGKACTKCGEVKPLGEFSKDKTKGDGRKSACLACDRLYREENREKLAERARRYREENLEKEADRGRRYREENGEKVAERHRRYREQNREAAAERTRRWSEQNREAVAERTRRYYEENREAAAERTRRYYKDSPEKVIARCANRRASRLNATPLWADRAKIVAVYAAAARLAEETGVPHHVDHIVPLQNPHVCGLHVPWNLRPLPAVENMSKNNRLSLDDGVPYFAECL